MLFLKLPLAPTAAALPLAACALAKIVTGTGASPTQSTLPDATAAALWRVQVSLVGLNL